MARTLLTSTVLDPAEKERQAELIRHCAVSRLTRQEQAMRLRDWYERGKDQGRAAVYNKLFAHINMISSFLFSPSTVRFGIHLPPSVRARWMPSALVARDEFRNTWESLQIDTDLLTALEWSLVYGSVIPKVQPDNEEGFRIGYILPWDFGVSREDIRGFDDQDVCCHWYSLSLPQVERWVGQEPGGEDLIALAKSAARPAPTGRTRSQLVLSQITGTFPGGTISGGFPGATDTDARIDPMVEEPTVEFVDVWERRMFKRKRKGMLQQEELFEDWMVTTFLEDLKEPIARRRNPDLPWTRTDLSQTIPGELPFLCLSPRPIIDSFWGRSELENLTQLQLWLDDHVSDLRAIVKKQMNPPTFFSGVPDAIEAGRALNTAGGAYSSPEPNARMQPIQPQLTSESIGLLTQILQMFSDVSGVPESISEPANMPGGVRATGHFSMAAGIGAGRLRQMALIVEEVLGQLATKGFHIMQRHSTELYQPDDGQPFLLSQIPYLVSLSVNSHSAAPIFQEQTQAKAILLQKAGALSPEDFVELVDPPNREELKMRAKDIAKNKSQVAQEMMDIQRTKAEKGGKGPAPKNIA